MLNFISSARTRAPRILRAALIGVALGAAAACGGDPAGPAKQTLAPGTYEMLVVGEFPVPKVIQDGPLTWQGTDYDWLFVRVNGGWIELHEDHTFKISISISIDSDPGGSEEGFYERSGTYTVVDDRIELDIRQPARTSWSGRWNGDRLGFDVPFLDQYDDPWFIGFELRRN
jgi:hypothetical protein